MTYILFPSARNNEYNSYRAGESFGELFVQFRPYMTNNQLAALVKTLRVRSSLDLLSYQVGFEHGYRNARIRNGNRLPFTVELTRQENILMGKLMEAKKQTQGFNGFLKVSQLADNNVRFCIRSITRGFGTYGDQWVLQIEVSELDAIALNMDEHTTATVTVPFDPDKLSSKDRMFQSLMIETPVHNAVVKAIPLQGGKSYNDFDETTDKVCVCGYEEVEAEFNNEREEGDEELENRPF